MAAVPASVLNDADAAISWPFGHCYARGSQQILCTNKPQPGCNAGGCPTTRRNTAGVSILQILEGGSGVKAAERYTVVKQRGREVSAANAEATKALTSREVVSVSGIAVFTRKTAKATEGQGYKTRTKSDLPRQYGSGTCAVRGQETYEHFQFSRGSFNVQKFNEVILT